MPDPIYQIIQIHDAVDSSTLQFPKVPWEAVVKSVEQRFTPVGIPATVIQLAAKAISAPIPTEVGQRYYNMTTKLIHTAIQSGSSIVWDAGADAVDGMLYSVEEGSPRVDTLYIKSVVNDVYGGLVKLQSTVPGTAYDGPFKVQWANYANSTACNCTVVDESDPMAARAGYVCRGNTLTAVQAVTGLNVPDGSSIYLYVIEGSPAVIAVGNYAGSGEIIAKVRLATNKGGRMHQCHYGDVEVVSVTTTVHIPSTVYPAPTISASIPNRTPTNQDVVLTATFDPAITTKEYSLDQITWSPYPEEGVTNSANRTVYFRGHDDLQDMTEIGSYTITNIDTTEPTVNYVYSPTDWTNGNVTATVTFSGDTEQAGYHLYEDSLVPTDEWTTLNLVTEGNQKVAEFTITENCLPAVTAVDGAGNQTGTVPLGNVTNIDRTAPTITGSAVLAPGGITPVADTYYISKTAKVSASKPANTAPIAAYWFKLGGTAADTAGWTKSNTSAASCTYDCASNGTCFVRVYDAAGNYAATSMTMDHINNDTLAAPTVTHSPTALTNGDVTMTAIGDSSAVKIFYRQGTSGNYTSATGSSATVTATANGTWYFYATNNADTQSPVVSHTISNIDKTPPDIRLWGYDSSTTLAETYCSASAYNESSLPIFYQFSEDGTTYGTSSSYNPALPLARNGYYKYFATDAAGNVGSAVLHLTNLYTIPEPED